MKRLLIVISLFGLLGAGGQNINTGHTRVIFPSSIVPGMSVWLSADCITYTSSVCGTPANGSTLTTWADHSGNANNVTINAGTCTFNTAQVNSLPAVTFASCRGSLGTVITATNGHTAFVVMSRTTSTAGFVWGSASAGGFAYFAASTATAQGIDRQNTANVGAAMTHLTSGVWTQQNGFVSNAAGGFAIGFRTASATDTTSSSTSSSITTNGPSGIGADLQGTPASFFSGQIAEIIYYNQTLTLTQIQQNEAYFRAKYGIL